MQNLVRKNYWATVAAATILPGIIAGIIEYVVTKGVSGWLPLAAALIGGLLTMAVLWLIEKQRSHESPASPELPDPPESPGSMTEGKIFSPRTPAELVAEVEGLTEIAAEDVSRRHIGQWLKVEGRIFNVSGRGDRVRASLSSQIRQPFIALYFVANDWREILKAYNSGDRLSAIGKIEAVSSGSITLEECELVNRGSRRTNA